MIEMTLGEIATAVGGSVSAADAGVTVSGPAFVDSRSTVADGLFVAVAGERVDGHEFAHAAVEAGAAGVLAARQVAAPSVVVDDVVGGLGRLARHVRAQLRDLTVVGVTGSQGKTSAKDMLAVILGAAGQTVATAESFNNEIGLPLTMLRATATTRYLVAELGTRGPGQIGFLAEVVRPTIGLVLNVGVAHIGEFGTQDAIATAKGELVAALPPTGLAVLNSDDHRVSAMAARTSAAVLTFGTSAGSDVRFAGLDLDADGHPAMRLTWRRRSADLTLGYVGVHHAANAAAAAAVALGMGLDLDSVVASLRGAQPLSHWRMAVSTSPEGVVVINDAYNANPDSMRAAVAALVEIARRRGAGRTFAVLGEMLELGEASRREHEAIGPLVARLGVTRLLAVGPSTRPAQVAASQESSWAGVADYVGDSAAALELLRGELRPGDVVLVKASRAAGLEGLAAALTAGLTPTMRTGGGR